MKSESPSIEFLEELIADEEEDSEELEPLATDTQLRELRA
jgi:hypothetical protein